MKIEYKLKRVPGKEEIYLVSCKDKFDLGMLFIRVQEFYESPFTQIQGKRFELCHLMRLYSNKFGNGAFTYMDDFVGYNVSSKTINKLYKEGNIVDVNSYDTTFLKIIAEIEKLTSNDYYLIGTLPKDTSTINHELCHAFFHLNETYRKETLSIVYKLPDTIIKKITKHLTTLGYNPKVFSDEIQAYIGGDVYDLIDNIKFNKREEKTLKKAHESIFKLALSAKLKDI